MVLPLPISSASNTRRRSRQNATPSFWNGARAAARSGAAAIDASTSIDASETFRSALARATVTRLAGGIRTPRSAPLRHRASRPALASSNFDNGNVGHGDPGAAPSAAPSARAKRRRVASSSRGSPRGRGRQRSRTRSRPASSSSANARAPAACAGGGGRPLSNAVRRGSSGRAFSKGTAPSRPAPRAGFA